MGISHSPKIVTDGLVLALDAADNNSYPGTGNTWKDLSGNGRNVTLINGPSYSSSNGGVVVFDGTNDHARLPLNIFKKTLPNFSISVWFNNQTDGILLGNHYHYSKWESIWTSTNLFRVNGASNHTTNRQSLSFTLPSFNVWNNLTFVNSSLLSYMKVFHNGIQIATKTATVIPWNSTILPTIGAQKANDGTTRGAITGNISQISIYNKALTSKEVLQNYNATKTRFGL